MIEQLSQPVVKEKEQSIRRVELPFIDLKDNRRNTESKECYLELYPTHICYKVIGRYETLNEDTGIWEEKSANYRWTRKRADLSDVSMLKDNKYDTWYFGIEFPHITDGCGWHFNDPKECHKVYEIVKDYMVSV